MLIHPSLPVTTRKGFLRFWNEVLDGTGRASVVKTLSLAIQTNVWTGAQGNS